MDLTNIFDKVITWLVLALAALWTLTFGGLSKRIGAIEKSTADRLTGIDQSIVDLKCHRAKTDEKLDNIETRIKDGFESVKEMMRNNNDLQGRTR